MTTARKATDATPRPERIAPGVFRFPGVELMARTTYPCGCVNAIDAPSGVLRCLSKCRTHRAAARDPAGLDAAYYARCGVIDGEGNRLPTAHVDELAEALGPLPGPYAETSASAAGFALEIGGGISPYAGRLIESGWYYVGVEPSGWACDWMARAYGACAIMDRRRFDDATDIQNESWPFILAAHCLEHMPDAPAAVRQFAGLLAPGGELWIVVPDDSDPTNPDHLVFFTPDTLRSCVEAAGLAVERLEVRRHVAHERFLYLRGRKP